MKEELGLEIVQESMMDKQLSKEDFDETISNIIKFLSKEKRNFTTLEKYMKIIIGLHMVH